MSSYGAPSGRPRLADVAAAAGVSAMTVSRALREPHRLHPQTLKQILAKVDELGYLPNGSARSLASRRSRIVAAVVPTLSYSVYAGTLQGLSDGLRGAGFELMLGDSGYSVRNERSLVEAFIARGVDALVLTGVEHDRATRDLVVAHALPIAEIWDLGREPLGLSIGFSNRAAGRAVGKMLAALGRRHWGFIGTQPAREHRSHKRMEGFRKAAQEAGLRRPIDAFVENAMMIGEARAAAERLLCGSARIDAVFCANDLLACGLLQVAGEHGRRVPEDLAVVGFGDFDIASIVTPALTTVRIPGYRMGVVAAELLLALVAGEGCAASTVDLGFELVRRRTA
ncbi:MAG: LacI family DNA-binding transcriptional regulator [Lautropia sp.]|nr:LacI family DNA-binding transcriptional regulator [Lautropia sp.]